MTQHADGSEPRDRPPGLDHFDDNAWENPPNPAEPAGEAAGRRRSRAIVTGVGVGAAVVIAALAGLWFLGGADDGDEAAVSPPSVESPLPAPGEPDFVSLPPLDASDDLIRRLLAVLSDHPDVLAWLLGDDLIRHVVVAVDNVADGVSPRRALRGLAPSGAFRIAGHGDDLRLHPGSYTRYDPVADAIAEADVPGLVGVIRTTMPLLESAYDELGRPDRGFPEALLAALDRLVAVPVPQEPVLLTARTLRYQFADPTLERLDPASKHLLRFGPDNQRKVQATLARLAEELRARLPPR